MATRVVRVLLCCLVVLCGLGVVGSPPVGVADSSTAPPPSIAFGGERDGGVPNDAASSIVARQDDEDPTEQAEPTLAGYDVLSVEIDVYGNGSAGLTFEYQYRLDDGNQSVDWEELRRDVEDRPDAYLAAFEDRRNETLTAAENQTDRNMSMRNFAVETDERSMPNEHGYVRFTFHWSSFAYVEANLIEVGDSLEGFTMTEETRLVISWPEDYQTASVVPEPDERRDQTVMWYGDETREFVDGEPHLELLRTGGEPVQSPQETDGLLPISTPVSSTWLVVLVGLIGLLVFGGGAWAWSARARDDGPESPPPAATPPDEPVEPAEPPLELLSNEERVMRLLEMRGGRIKQQEVVSELDWTEAKTSQVVSGLRESGEIDVFRIGRENVLSLPEEEGRDGADDGEGAEPGGATVDDASDES